MKNCFSQNTEVPLSFKRWLRAEKGFMNLKLFYKFLDENGRQYEYYYYLCYSEYLKEVLNLREGEAL